MSGFRTFLFVCLALLSSVPLRAQQPTPTRPARLLVTVVDQSNAVVPNAAVTVTGLEDATRKTIAPPAQTSPGGIATIDGLAPGRYSIQAEFPGCSCTGGTSGGSTIGNPRRVPRSPEPRILRDLAARDTGPNSSGLR